MGEMEEAPYGRKGTGGNGPRVRDEPTPRAPIRPRSVATEDRANALARKINDRRRHLQYTEPARFRRLSRHAASASAIAGRLARENSESYRNRSTPGDDRDDRGHRDGRTGGWYTGD